MSRALAGRTGCSGAKLGFIHYGCKVPSKVHETYDISNYRVEKQNLQVVKPLRFEHLNGNMVQNSSPTCKHILFALINSKKLIVKCLGM